MSFVDYLYLIFCNFNNPTAHPLGRYEASSHFTKVIHGHSQSIMDHPQQSNDLIFDFIHKPNSNLDNFLLTKDREFFFNSMCFTNENQNNQFFCDLCSTSQRGFKAHSDYTILLQLMQCIGINWKIF